MNHKVSSPQKTERRLSIYAFLALLLALFSYYWANRHPEYTWDGPIMLVVAAGLLLFVIGRLERNKESTVVADSHASPSNSSTSLSLWHRLPLKQVARWRIVVFWVSVGLTMVLLSRLMVLNQPSYTDEVLLWLGAMGMFVLSVAPPVSRPREDWGLWWEVNRNTVLILALITGVAFLLRIWNVGTIPSTLGGDEASQGLEGIRVISGDIRNPFTTGWLGVPTMSFFFQSITIRLFGPTMTALRLPWVFVGTSTVLLTFWLVTRLRGLTLGLTTAALLATYHYHIHYSRLGSNQIADPFFMALALLFLYRARDRNSPLDWAITGVVVGLAQYFYAGGRLTIVVVAACLFYFFWLDRARWQRLRNTLGGALTVATAFIITAAPMLQYAYRFPNDYNARVNEVGIFQSGWVKNEMATRGVSMWTLLWEQFERAFLAFNVYPDRTFWYGSPEPLMDEIWGVLFLLGLLYVTLRLLPPYAEPRFFPLVAWWWAGMLLGGVLTESPPSSQRLIVLAPPACFFIAVILWRMLQFLQKSMIERQDMRYTAPLMALSVVGLSVLSIRWYFWDYTPLNVYGNRNGQIATHMGFFLADELEADQIVVFLGPPNMYLGFATIPYLAPQAEGDIDVHEPLTQPPTVESLGVPAGKRPFFIAGTWRVNELDLVEQAFPGGKRLPVANAKGETLFWVYEP